MTWDTSKDLTVSGEAAYAAVERLFALSAMGDQAGRLGHRHEERALMDEWWAGHRMMVALFGRKTWDELCTEYNERHPEHMDAFLRARNERA